MPGLAQLSELFAAIFMAGVAGSPPGSAGAEEKAREAASAPRVVEVAGSLRAARRTVAEVLGCSPNELAESCRLPDGRVVYTAASTYEGTAPPPPPAASIERRFSGWVVRKGDSCAQLSPGLGEVPIP